MGDQKIAEEQHPSTEDPSGSEKAITETQDARNPQNDGEEHQDEKNQSEEAENEKEYPPFKIVLPAMAAIWMAFFLVALVSLWSLT